MASKSASVSLKIQKREAPFLDHKQKKKIIQTNLPFKSRRLKPLKLPKLQKCRERKNCPEYHQEKYKHLPGGKKSREKKKLTFAWAQILVKRYIATHGLKNEKKKGKKATPLDVRIEELQQEFPWLVYSQGV